MGRLAFGRLPIGVFPLARRRTRGETVPESYVVEEEYTGANISEIRKPVFWGGMFDTKRSYNYTSRYGSPPGYKYATAYARLPQLRYFGEREHHPELVVIISGVGMRRVGKNVQASHWVKQYAVGDRVNFPVFYFSGGDELRMRGPVRDQFTADQIDEYRFFWRNRNGVVQWHFTQLPNVLGLAPPYKSENVQSECDEVFFVNPLDMTRELFLSSTMLKSVSTGTTAQPQYMQLATEIERLIREEGAGQAACEKFVEGWVVEHPDSWDKRSGKKILGAINDIYRKVLRSDAPTMEDWINKRRGGKPYVYIVDFGENEGADRYFGEHLVGSIARANERNRRNMVPRGSYTPPVLVIDEAGTTFCPYTGSRIFPNRIVEYLEKEGKYAAPTILISQSRYQLDDRIIPNEMYLQGGLWTHLFKVYPNHMANYVCRLQKSEYVVTGEDKQGNEVTKHYTELDDQELEVYMEKNPPYFKMTAAIRMSEVYSPT